MQPIKHVFRRVLTSTFAFERGACVSWGGGALVFNATFNNISAISRRTALLVEETVVPGENLS